MQIKEIKKIVVDQMGFVTADQIKMLVEDAPALPLVIRWGLKPRQRVEAQHVEKCLEQGITGSMEYLRDVFIPSEEVQMIKKSFGW